MGKPESITIKTKKKSVTTTVLTVILAILGIAAIGFLIYKLFGKKIKKWLEEKHFSPYVKLDTDGDGEADAALFDTTGDGEIDTVVLTDHAE